MTDHRERIVALINADNAINLITPPEEIIKANSLVRYSCPHKTIEILARSFKGNSCTICKKEKKNQQVNQQIYPPQINFDDYKYIELVDEKAADFNRLTDRQVGKYQINRRYYLIQIINYLFFKI